MPNQNEPSLFNDLAVTGGRISRFMTFPKTLARSETQAVLSRIWTQITDSISYDNRYANENM